MALLTGVDGLHGSVEITWMGEGLATGGLEIEGLLGW